jgi:hypothetical protein
VEEGAEPLTGGSKGADTPEAKADGIVSGFQK